MLEMERLTPQFENDFPNRQTIDRNTGVFLRSVGSANHPGIQKFSLYGFGEPINFNAHYAEIERKGQKPELQWRVLGLVLPKELEGRRTEIEGVIVRAMEAHGSSYDTQRYEKVTAEFVTKDTGKLKLKFENDYANRQTIDRDTGVFLTFDGGVNHPGILKFSLHVGGERIEFFATDNRLESPAEDPSRPSIHWEFFQVLIPPHLDDCEEEIIELITEALKVHGFAYKRQRYGEVTAEYVPPKIPDI